jgi:hypothetical protein
VWFKCGSPPRKKKNSTKTGNVQATDRDESGWDA